MSELLTSALGAPWRALLSDASMLHAAVVHLPVALSVLGLPLVVLHLLHLLRRGDSPALRGAVLGVYVALAVSALAAVRSGSAAKGELGVLASAGLEHIARHELLARRVAWLALVTAAATTCTRLRRAARRRLAGGAMLGGALATAVCTAFVGHHGGAAVYAFGAGTPRPVTDEAVSITSSKSDRADPRAALFEDVVAPWLVSTCVGCHSGPRAAGGLDLTHPGGLLRGGLRGAAIHPGSARQSVLFQAVSGTHGELVMPPNGKPTDPATLDALRRWIDAGAVWVER